MCVEGKALLIPSAIDVFSWRDRGVREPYSRRELAGRLVEGPSFGLGDCLFYGVRNLRPGETAVCMTHVTCSER